MAAVTICSEFEAQKIKSATLGTISPSICHRSVLKKKNYVFLAVLGLHCFTWAFSSCSEQGLLFIVVCGLLIAVASLVAEDRP